MHANETTRPARGRTACLVPLATVAGPSRPDGDDEVPDDDLEPELLDPGDLEIDDTPGGDAACWDVFIPDDDECDPLPEPGDFWVEDRQQSRVEGQEPRG